MAEFCLECWNRINETNDSKRKYVLSWEKDLCKECSQYKRVIIVERRWARAQRILSEALQQLKQLTNNTP